MKPTDISQPNYFHKVVDCQWACPAHTPVPEYIRLIAARRYTEAFLINWESNVFPGILGLRQGKTDDLKLVDPTNATNRIGIEQSKTAGRTGVRRDQTKLFVQVNGAHGLADRTGQFAHPEKLAVFCGCLRHHSYSYVHVRFAHALVNMVV